jgi:hypothetical protein
MSIAENHFSIRRPLHPNDVVTINDAKQNLPQDIVTPRPDHTLGLTVVEGHFISRHLNKNATFREPQARYDHIFKPIVPTALEQQVVNVNDVRYFGSKDRWNYFGNRLGQVSLALVLDDPEGTLAAEHAAYSNRVKTQKKLGATAFNPHITLVTVPYERATPSLLSALESHIPDTITLQPVKTWSPELLPYEMQAAIDIHNGITPKPRPVPEQSWHRHVHSETHYEDIKLRSVISHPIAFINSLRKEHDDKNDLDNMSLEEY